MPGGANSNHRALLRYPAVEQVNRAFRVVLISGIMGDLADGGTTLVDVAKEVHNGVAIFGIEVSGGSSARRIMGSPTRARATARHA
jgi:hypothetical protein